MDDPSLIQPILNELKDGFKKGKIRSVEYRKQALRNMIAGLNEFANEFIEAHKKDLGIKEPYLVRSAHIGSCINDFNHIIQNIDQWVKAKEADCNLFIGGGEAYIIPEPYGVCLVLGAWNFPLPLCLKPAAAAISAGNCVCIKPSEVTPNISNVIKKMFDKYMDKDCFRVLEGGLKIAGEICTHPWDLIFFTGGTVIGKKVARAAAENLVPCILELGGKNPTIIDEDADIESAAKRIAFTKLNNSGQLCVAPDYVYCHKSKKDQFVKAVINNWKQFYGEEPQKSKDLTRIVNETHTNRLINVLEDDHKGKVTCGGTYDKQDKYIAPTIIENPSLQSKMMNEEIFGPIMPIIDFEDLGEVIDFINAHPKPLALYYFGNRKDKHKLIIEQTSAGGVLINDCFFHLLNDEIPFGGVGASGYGSYHGKFGFENCSHLKPVMKKSNYNGFPFDNRFPPYTPDKMKKMRYLNLYGSNILVGATRRKLQILIVVISLLIVFFMMSKSSDVQNSDL